MRDGSRYRSPLAAVLLAVVFVPFGSSRLLGDGKLMRSRGYEGSLEEKAQEAIIILQPSKIPGKASEDLILKITVEGEVERFAWVIPFPNEPVVEKADAKLFKELFDYVQYRQRSLSPKGKKFGMGGGAMGAAEGVDLLSRKIVGSYDVAIVREKTAGTLNKWLDAEGYQSIQDGQEVIEFYRKKGYVFTCIKVSDAKMSADSPVDLHPLRFTFATGGRDGIYFPMRMTGLQKKPFDVNLYVFLPAWLNDRLNEYGYEHRGFHRNYRDWDTPQCRPNAGKHWAKPRLDPFLRSAAGRIGSVAKLFEQLHPDGRYYLTNIRAFGLDPADVRDWKDDLWLFPYYLDKRFMPYDVRQGGPAAAGYER